MHHVQVLIDNVQDRNGSLYEDYEFLQPKMIKVSGCRVALVIRFAALLQSCPADEAFYRPR